MADQNDSTDPQREDPRNPLDACKIGPFPQDILSIANPGHLRECLSREDAEFAVLRQRSFDPDSEEAKHYRDLQIRTAQLQNTLEQWESREFWQAVTNGCASQLAAVEETDPGIKHAEALLREWREERRADNEHSITMLMQANMSPSGRAWRALEFTQGLLIEEAKYGLRVYQNVCDEFKQSEMLAPDNLDRLRCKMAHHVAWSMIARKDATHRYFTAAGWSEPQPGFRRYMQAAFRVLEKVDTALDVMRTKYALRPTACEGVKRKDRKGANTGLATPEVRSRRRRMLTKYQKDHSIRSKKALAMHLGIGLRSIQGIVSGDRSRYSNDTFEVLLKKIGCSAEVW